MTIDLHAHTVPEPFLRRLREEVPQAAPELVQRDGAWWLEFPGGRISGPIPEGMFDTGARLADMDAAGIDVHALSVPPPHFLYRLAPEAAAVAASLHNDAMLDMARDHPDRFVVLGHLPMQSEEHALAELERLAGMREVVGLELGTNVAGTNLGAGSFEAVWEAIDALGLGVVLHPGADVAGADRMHDHYLHNFVGNPTDTTVAAGSLIFGGVLSRHERLRIALLHGGGFLPYQIGRFDHGWSVRPEAKERLDVAPSSLLGRFWFDTLTHDAPALRFLLERVGADRLCLGSDYPFDMADADPVGSVRTALGDDPELLDAVLEGTAKRFLTRVPS